LELSQFPQVKKVKQLGPQAFIVNIPRYQEFTHVALGLAENDVRFAEVAGNQDIPLAVLAPPSWHYGEAGGLQLFSTPVLTHPELHRVVIECEVTSLDAMLNTLRREGVAVEHLYDY